MAESESRCIAQAILGRLDAAKKQRESLERMAKAVRADNRAQELINGHLKTEDGRRLYFSRREVEKAMNENGWYKPAKENHHNINVARKYLIKLEHSYIRPGDDQPVYYN